jgi:hypothetical protein
VASSGAAGQASRQTAGGAATGDMANPQQPLSHRAEEDLLDVGENVRRSRGRALLMDAAFFLLFAALTVLLFFLIRRILR